MYFRPTGTLAFIIPTSGLQQEGKQKSWGPGCCRGRLQGDAVARLGAFALKAWVITGEKEIKDFLGAASCHKH